MALAIFTITIFVSAFLLFLVQPLVGKMILPKLGGTPQVWNTCMVFFQSALLLGYAYTHSVSTRLRLRQQLIVHCVLLLIPLAMMLAFPMYDTVQGWGSLTEGTPVVNTLILLATIVGVPFFVVSTSAPLLQKWFGYSGHETAGDPYFLYSASNAGSLLSLFIYPALMEPLTFLHNQPLIWFGGYVALAALVMYCAFLIYKTAPSDEQILALEAAAGTPPPPVEVAPPEPAPVAAPEASTAVKAGPGPGGGGGGGSRGIQRKKGMKPPAKPEIDKRVAAEEPLILTGATAEMTMWRRIRWVLLAAIPSSLMLGVTSYISTDLSPFPLVWIVPLALYLLSFILVYSKFRYKGFSLDWTGKRVQAFGYSWHQVMLYVGQPIGLIILCFIAIRGGFDPFFATFLLWLGFFLNALACHGELAVDRPDPRHLTEYFLLMSVGGMVGGMFNGIIAPIVFQASVLEFFIAIVVACVIRPQYILSGWFDELVMQSFPQFQNWARNQGDEMAKLMGRPAPHTTYLFSYFIDIVFGLFVMGFSYWLTTRFGSRDSLKGIIQFLGLPKTEEWERYIFNTIVLGVPLVFCFFFAGRPMRLTLAVLGLMLGNMYFTTRDDRTPLAARRTYFGLLRVEQSVEHVLDAEENEFLRTAPVNGKYAPPYPFTFLMHGTTYHGRNYYKSYSDDYQKYRVDLSRLATTYYHRYGPVGIVMEQYNYGTLDKNGGGFRGRQNSFSGDARGPVTIIGNIAASLSAGNALPLTAMTDCWTDPPYATIGLGTGTMASYVRPFQHMTYYEIDEVIREFSVPPPDKTAYFTYLQGAIKRGVNLEVVMGDARLSLEPKREKLNLKNSLLYHGTFGKIPAVDDDFKHSPAPDRENFYKVIVVDAFSSDAIPIHLCTLEALEIYMSKLSEDGVLCMHTSNRHMDLVRPIARITMEMSKKAKKKGQTEINCVVGKDLGDKGRYMGHFTSEYVMIYRGDGFSNYLKKLDEEKTKLTEAGVMKNLAEEGEKGDLGRAPNGKQILNAQVEWYNPYTDHGRYTRTGWLKEPVTASDSLWTDDYSYILGVLR